MVGMVFKCPLADVYGKHLKAAEYLMVPSVVLYEVYKILKKEISARKRLSGRQVI
jgi:hypothetical protein